MFQVVFTLVSPAWCGLPVYIITGGISQWHKDNNSPRLTLEATVAAKRQRVSHHSHSHAHTHSHSMSTSYYATFQAASGERMELHVSGREYGMLAEGDFGDLSFQGTRYLGFVRR